MTERTDEQLRERLTQLTRDLILVPTTASRKTDMARGFQFIKNHLEDMSKVRILDFENKENPSILVLPEGIDHPDVLICAHLDVVEYPSAESFRSRIEDGRIVGPGAGDMKGAMAVGLEIFRRFHSEKPGLSLGLAITSDEEQGGYSGIGYLVAEKNLRCGIALVPDGGSLNQVTTHEKGILHLKGVCRGHYSHASRPWEGDNALMKLMTNLLRIEALFDQLKPPEGYWYPTCSPTIVRTHNEAFNRIPDEAEVVMDIRFPQPFTSAEMVEKIREATDDDMDLEVLIKAEPSELRPDSSFFKAIEKVTGGLVEEVKDHGGSDARFFAAKGIPVIISRPKVGLLHSEEEWIDIESMVQFFRIYERFIGEKLKVF